MWRRRDGPKISDAMTEVPREIESIFDVIIRAYN
jgi:hypothetical protein